MCTENVLYICIINVSNCMIGHGVCDGCGAVCLYYAPLNIFSPISFYFTFSHHINRNSVEIIRYVRVFFLLVSFSSTVYTIQGVQKIKKSKKALIFYSFIWCRKYKKKKTKRWMSLTCFFLPSYTRRETKQMWDLLHKSTLCMHIHYFKIVSACLKCMKFTQCCVHRVHGVHTTIYNTRTSLNSVSTRCTGSVIRLLTHSRGNNDNGTDIRLSCSSSSFCLAFPTDHMQMRMWWPEVGVDNFIPYVEQNTNY